MTGTSLSSDSRRAGQRDSAERVAFEVACGDFWRSLAGRRSSRFGSLIALPPALPPLDDMLAAKRKRALIRRDHQDVIRAASATVMTAHLRA